MTVESKDLRILKTDYASKVKSVSERVGRLEKRIDWLEKLLWMSGGAVISSLAGFILRRIA